jgi:hypothetical protein
MTLLDPQLANMSSGKDLNVFSAETLRETTLNVRLITTRETSKNLVKSYLHFPGDPLYIFVPISQEIKSESFGNSG